MAPLLYSQFSCTPHQPEGFNGNIHGILRPIHRGMLEFVGFSVLAPHIVYGPAHISREERMVVLDQYRKRLDRIEREERITVGYY